MGDIILHKKNEVFFQVECERSIARELNDFFSYDVPEAKFMPAYKNRVWDENRKVVSKLQKKSYLELLQDQKFINFIQDSSGFLKSIGLDISEKKIESKTEIKTEIKTENITINKNTKKIEEKTKELKTEKK